MSDTLVGLHRKISGAGDLKSVVRSMKALAASSIGQYEQSVLALGRLLSYRGIGLDRLFEEEGGADSTRVETPDPVTRTVNAIVFGSDQGLVGQFNGVLGEFVAKTLDPIPSEKRIWAVGRRIESRLEEAGLEASGLFDVPTSVDAITSLVGRILVGTQSRLAGDDVSSNSTFFTTTRQPARPTNPPVNVYCPWIESGNATWVNVPGQP